MVENPHLAFKGLPSYSPQLNPIERFWKVLRLTGDAQPTVRRHRGPEEIGSGQPAPLSDGSSSDPDFDQWARQKALSTRHYHREPA
jgi:hypothetical protein